jgi:AcrR family transcriptional regulator
MLLCVSRMAFYRNFASKEDVIFTGLYEEFNEIVRHVKSPEKHCKALFCFLKKKAHL